MDVFNKFYSTAVSQLSGVLPGNNVTREYEILEQICTSGVGLMWKVYNGYKKSTKQEVSVFVFEKKTLERWSKDERDTMLELLRRGVQQLTKIRHPHVLTVQHPLEESRDSLAFATEPVFDSLANVIGKEVHSNKTLYDIEIRHGLLQLFDGLQFLHNDAKILHRNICAETIIINKNRSWKLFGFDFCIGNQPGSDGKPYWPHREYSTSAHVLTQPSLEYTAPEIALNNINTPDSDLFSLGVLIYAIYCGKPLKMFGRDYSSFRRYANELNQRKYPPMNDLPKEVVESVKALLHPSPSLRPKLHELKEINYFHDVGVKTLNYLDSLYQWDNLQKSKFYKGLQQILPSLPHRVNLHSILPHLVKEFVNSPMIPFVLPNVLHIAEASSQKEYCDHILPHLKPIFKLTDPIQILLIFMQKMDLLLKLTPADEVKLHVLPLLYRSLECDMPQIQELCLNVLPTFSTLIDYNAMKNAVIPRIKKLCLSSCNVSVKVNCLVSIGKLLQDLDKWLVLDEILPFLQQIQSREPAIVMAIIGIYKIAMTNTKLGITKDVMALKCIPFLVPLIVENGLTVAQFNTVVALIKEMLQRIEQEQREKLQQLSTVQRENKPKDATDILVNELEHNLGNNKSSTSSQESNKSKDNVFCGFEIIEKPPITQNDRNTSAIKNQAKTSSNGLKISYNSAPKQCMQTTTTTMAQANINDYSKMNASATYGVQTTLNANSRSTNSNSNALLSINPLVTNQHLVSPQSSSSSNSNTNTNSSSSSSNNNFSSLDDLDPFKDGNIQTTADKSNTTSASNPYTLQQQTVNYIYPTSYGNSAMNAAKRSSASSLLAPTTQQVKDNKNLNMLSHQEIMNFLN